MIVNVILNLIMQCVFVESIKHRYMLCSYRRKDEQGQMFTLYHLMFMCHCVFLFQLIMVFIKLCPRYHGSCLLSGGLPS